MEIFVVGGSVRDVLLGRTPTDIDYVVVGSNHQEMIDLNFTQVGADFPVYLHPTTGEEYALARQERSTGPSYNEFVLITDDVTLHQDLMRRDLTINALAVPLEQWPQFLNTGDVALVVDCFNGIRDLTDRIIRHVSDAFKEDPVRLLRVCRFAARYRFTVHPDTIAMLRDMSQQNMFMHLTPQRVWTELSRTLDESLNSDYKTSWPIKFFDILSQTDAWSQIFPLLDPTDIVEPNGTRRNHFQYACNHKLNKAVMLMVLGFSSQQLLNISGPADLIKQLQHFEAVNLIWDSIFESTVYIHNEGWLDNFIQTLKTFDVLRNLESREIVDQLFTIRFVTICNAINNHLNVVVSRSTIDKLCEIRFSTLDTNVQQRLGGSEINQHLWDLRKSLARKLLSI